MEDPVYKHYVSFPYQIEKQRAEAEKQRADKERREKEAEKQRADEAEDRAARLASKLKELNIDFSGY